MDPGFDAVLEPYRVAARRVADRLDLPILDTPAVLRTVVERWVDGNALLGPVQPSYR